jgi:DNA polymerase (family X)
MKILNTIHEDYHIHSLNYSDGMNTVDEIVQYAGKIGMKKIIITDHSQATLDHYGLTIKNRRSTIHRWKNVHNAVEVSFGVEWDLLDEQGNCCFHIDEREWDFCILSCHPEIYNWPLENITQAYVNAIHTYKNKIAFIWHPTLAMTSQYLDVPILVKALNQYNIPVELNCSSFGFGRLNLEKTNELIHLVEAWVYVNSDLHVLNDFSIRQAGFDYLKAQWLK